MTREQLILRPDGVRAEPGGVAVEVRMPWYRSLPLSAISTIAITVDGQAVDPAATVIDVCGRSFRPAELHSHHELVWFIQDPATVHVQVPNVKAGETHSIGAGIGLRLPYIIIEGVGPLERFNEITLDVTIEQEVA